MGATDMPALPAARSPLSARAFGDHLLLGELIGRGGMSRVYRGWVRGSGHEVAVKILRDDLASRPDAVQRFVRERDLLATVASPHVVPVHDLVVHGNEVGIVMDLVPGGHLRRAVTFPCTLGDAAVLAAQVADGLAAVHAAGVVHRDLKPENVLAERAADGGLRLRLTDFGISRLVDSAALTQTSVTGTPGYLAPEVAAGRTASAAADVYALGVMLYELCTGRQPFHAENPLLLVIAHTRQDPPRPLDMPDPLWEVLAGTLAKDPLGRPTARAVARRLRTLAPSLEGLPPCTVPPVAAPVAGPVAPVAGPVATPATGLTAGGAPATSQQPVPYAPSRFGPAVPPPGQAAVPSHRPRGGAAEVTWWPRRIPLPLAAGGSLAAIAVLLVAGVLAVRFISGGGERTVTLETPKSPDVASAPPSLQSTGSAAAEGGHSTPHVSTRTSRPLSGAPGTPSASVSGSPVASGSLSPSPSVTPGVPTLGSAARTPQERHSSDQQALLALGNVTAGTGTVSTVTVRYSSASGKTAGLQAITPVDGQSAYDVTVKGLVNGRLYTFTAEVCSTTKTCMTSAPYTFTPYGEPVVSAPKVTVAGTQLTIVAQPVAQRFHPGETACTLTITGTPADPQAAPQAVAPGGATLTYDGQPATAYIVTETCTTDGIADGAPASADPVTTGAAAA